MTKDEVEKNRNTLKKCPCCNGNIQDRTIALYTGLIKALYEVCKWCQTNKKHEFEMNEIKHLLGKNEYARFGDLVRFGGLIYKKEKASYGVNIERAREFFSGMSEIPLYLTINQITGQIVDKKMGKIGEVKNLASWISSENKLYDSKKNPYKDTQK